MKYIEMIKMAEQSNIEHARKGRTVVKPLSFEDRAAIANLYLYGGIVYEGSAEGHASCCEWTAGMRWIATEYFYVVVPHGTNRAIPLPWVTPWDRTARRSHKAWMRDFKARVDNAPKCAEMSMQ